MFRLLLVSLIIVLSLTYIAPFRQAVLSYFPSLRGAVLSVTGQVDKITQSAQDMIVRELKNVNTNVITPVPLQQPTREVLKDTTGSSLTRWGVISWTNQQRTKEGVASLTENPTLDSVADRKASDILAKQYFAHVSPSGAGVADLARDAGYEYALIGENLALGDFRSDQDIVDAWMNSPGHRANMLNAKYTDIGVAVKQGMYKGKMAWIGVQTFGKPRASCPQPDAALRARIDGNKAELGALETRLALLRSEMDAADTNGDRYTYNQKVSEYNDAVRVYNTLVTDTKDMVKKYNAEVDATNACTEK